MTFIYTHSGKRFSLIDPQPEDVDVSDIAYHLSMICRFNGACSTFYSVAQHCVLAKKLAFDFQLDALFHDAGEAYYGDISSPLKAVLQDVVGVEFTNIFERIDQVIFDAFNISWPIDPRVNSVDNLLFTLEWNAIMLGSPSKTFKGATTPIDFTIMPWTHWEARAAFERECRELGIK